MRSVARILICFIFITVANLPAATVTLAWNPSPDQTVTGYHLYYGVASRSYTNKVTVANVTMASVTGLQPGITYYFAATAFNAANTESDYSNEVSYSIPLLPADTACALTFANLTQAYDGQPKQPGVLTSPPGVPVKITYNGSATAPAAVGSYTVVATASAPGYSGSATNVFVITKGVASVTLSNLSQTYNRYGRAVAVTTIPAGLPVTVTYNGSTTPPILPGTYKVAGQVTSPYYTGDATGTLVVAKAKVEVNLANLVQTYNGTARKVLATTTPVGYKILYTYEGKSSAPTNAGSYNVVATLSSQTSYGSGKGTLIVNPAAATLTLANLTQAADGKPKPVTATSIPAAGSNSLLVEQTGGSIFFQVAPLGSSEPSPVRISALR